MLINLSATLPPPIWELFHKDLGNNTNRLTHNPTHTSTVNPTYMLGFTDCPGNKLITCRFLGLTQPRKHSLRYNRTQPS